jgi:purine-binding chemotaxis protein CheW
MGTRQYVTFRQQGFLLGVEITGVREVNRVLDITPVPHAPPFVRGLVNLRGQILTVLDLGLRLGLEPGRITPTTHNLVLKTEDVGLMVDELAEVVEAPDLSREQAPANLGRMDDKFIAGVVRMPDELLLVLSIESLLALD